MARNHATPILPPSGPATGFCNGLLLGYFAHGAEPLLITLATLMGESSHEPFNNTLGTEMIMKRAPVGILIAAMIVSLVVGGIAGFFLGVASTKFGASFLADLVEQEASAKTDNPTRLTRDRFELLYPENWKIDVADEDYDPDQMFSIDSPGAAYVMFVLGDMETNPEESLQGQIDEFSRLMGTPAVQPFETYGKLQGKGAILQGKILGTKVTVKAFACYSQGMTAIIVQQYPDEDLRYVKDGLVLIEESFVLKPRTQESVPNKPDADDSK